MLVAATKPALIHPAATRRGGQHFQPHYAPPGPAMSDPGLTVTTEAYDRLVGEKPQQRQEIGDMPPHPPPKLRGPLRIPVSTSSQPITTSALVIGGHAALLCLNNTDARLALLAPARGLPYDAEPSAKAGL